MNQIQHLTNKISELIEKLDCLVSKSLANKRNECAHEYESINNENKRGPFWIELILGGRKKHNFGRCKFCGIKMTYISQEYGREETVLGWTSPKTKECFAGKTDDCEIEVPK